MSTITKDFRLSALRNGVVIRPARNEAVDSAITHGAVLEMANLGFKVDPIDLNAVPVSTLKSMISDARTVIGADRNMRPIYPGFPKQVQELSTTTLLIEQLLHYWTAGEFLPNYPDVAREGLPLEDMARATREVKVMKAGPAAQHFIRTLTQKGVALSEDDAALLNGSVALADPSLDEVRTALDGARNGENRQALITAVFTDHNEINRSTVVKELSATAKNADQLLRLILALSSTSVESREADYARAVSNLSDKDASAVKMKTLSRPARRELLAQLDELTEDFNADALVARKNLWRRVMRMVHPYSMSLSTGSKRAADIIHSNVPYRTFNSLVEEGMANGEVEKVVNLLSEYQPGNLLRRLVAILRLVSNADEAKALSTAVRSTGGNSTVSTLVSAYNGVLSANDDTATLTRVAGRNNTLVTTERKKVNTAHITAVSQALLDALTQRLERFTAPVGKVGTDSSMAVPLVRRDLSTTDRTMDRGQKVTPAGKGDTVRLFSHWNNNQDRDGYIDVGAVVLDDKFSTLNTVTWDSWGRGREWATYSGDKNVSPGDDAAEYIDVDLSAVKKHLPKAVWVAMTLQSWSGFPLKNVDLIAGTMLRSEPDAGEVFDARSVTTAFKPTTEALQAVPLVVNLETGEMTWLDSSSGSTQQGVSAARDEAVGTVVYNEIARPRLTMGELAELWAKAHKAHTTSTPVDRGAVLGLLD